MPVRKGAYWYYTRTIEGEQYGIQCRVLAAPRVETRRRRPADGQPLPGEEILLDGNALAEGHDFFALGTST